MNRLKSCINIDDLGRLAAKKVPFPVNNYVEGGADDEVTLKQNCHSFNRYQIVPKALQDVSRISTATRVMGCEIALPFYISATGFSGMMCPQDAELAGVRAAAKFDTLYTASTFSNRSLEEIAQASAGDKLFQVYVLNDKTLAQQLNQRAKQAGFKAMVLTVDTIVGGNRERDARSGLSIPPRLTVKSAMQYMMRPRWLIHYLLSDGARLGNFPHLPKVSMTDSQAFVIAMGKLFKKDLTWADAEAMIQNWGGPFAIKGIMSVEDALRAQQAGASAVILSNHGGRQLDGCPAPIDLVAEVRAAVGDQMEIIVDGGIRRGTDIFKALALGANACSLGRAYVRGLSAGGQEGVEKALSILKAEFERCMILAGCSSIDQINASHIRRL
ncbi:L-lactate dehydrogenase (cytochrome) [Oceanospirillum multiglobuliferum]|uniref:Alpha-hydroxy-acid oxidizing enzyme n=1 Tax=Oceanospirillum multiglobuliferum TaxID=64969 RepID=A0A1T4PMN0_9GAMM|nr:alpha-hydroxy acid oxidase [Oceanospirillum multiglobuliferum]OPX55400.1 alpha-hydroxy-acid oxidizing enzyme [Oceanospirillum multiglobuliferum]SJZ92835.1 L-lactate dehydrogenase (cytochrome) [Oceanospirillum multiglobuliferum]